MTKRMLIDASHPEETRVVVLDGNRLEEFDVETENKKPLKGNIYLAKVVRVEPSLQAAFVEYGGNRHGFLAFGEIHPDYYQIPVADRQRLLEMQAAEAAEDEEDGEEVTEAEADAVVAQIEALADADEAERAAASEGAVANPSVFTESVEPEGANPRHVAPEEVHPVEALPPEEPADNPDTEALPPEAAPPGRAQPMSVHGETRSATPEELAAAEAMMAQDEGEEDEEETPPETLGGRGSKDEGDQEEVSRERRIPSRFMRHYKIQEVIRRRQIMLVQVVKEERGNKGAALTTYISLAGRFSVLMPNSPRGGGISRKITSAGDRKRLRDAIQEVGLPKGMSLIVRTAGASRPKPEIVRDGDYLLRLWDEIRNRTMESTAPALVYEEADLIKRSIRDVFSTGIEEIQIEGEDAYRQARDFMRMLMPQHERKIRIHRDSTPLFARNGVDAQLDAMMSPIVQLKSGGYIVINQTEALVSIDVNSGRATRDRHIEDTALRTNCEAAEEIARQLRLRDLAGLIVIDFIDMEASRNDAQVERRLKEALKHDRARIQVGRISHFGLLEMSRQRLRPSVTEHSFETCKHCQGLGIVRSPDSAALQVLRAIEEEGGKRKAAEICVHVAPELALHLLNRKRDRLAQIEERYGMAVLFEPDAKLIPPQLRIERTKQQLVAEPVSAPTALRMDYAPEPLPVEEEAEAVVPEEAAPQAEAAAAAAPQGENGAEGEGRKRRRRRRRRGGRREDGTPMTAQEAAEAEAEGDAEEGEEEAAQAEAAATPEAAPAAVPPAAPVAAEPRRDDRGPRREDGNFRRNGEDGGIRRRGRRGGNRFRNDEVAEPASAYVPEPQPQPRYAGPTPANPFAGGSLEDIFDAMAAAEEAALRAPAPVAPVPLPEPAAPEAQAPVAAQPAEAAPAVEVAPVPEVAAEPVAEQPVAAEPEPVVEAQPEAEAPAKPRRRAAAKPKAEPKAPRAPRGRKAAAAAEAPAEAAPAAVEAAPAAAEAVMAEAEVAPAKPSRRRAPKRAAAASAPEAAAEPEAVPAAQAPAAPAPVAPLAQAEAASGEPVAAAPVQPVMVDAADDAAPKKRGWWRR